MENNSISVSGSFTLQTLKFIKEELEALNIDYRIISEKNCCNCDKKVYEFEVINHNGLNTVSSLIFKNSESCNK